MQAVVEMYANAKGELLLKDTPAVIEDITINSQRLPCPVETTPCDFVEEQRIAGAKT